MGKAVRTALATVILGALLGFIVVSLGGPIVDQMQLLGQRESREARVYMIGVLENEADVLAALSPRGDLVARAMQYKMAEQSEGQWTPISLTYLGGVTEGSLQVHTYAIELRNATGREQFLSLALTLADGKVIRRE